MLLGHRPRLLPPLRLPLGPRVPRKVSPDNKEPDARRLLVRNIISKLAEPIYQAERSTREDEANREKLDGYW